MEFKKKAIHNRTIGLQTKVIHDAIRNEACQNCNGTGAFKINIPSLAIKNLRSSSTVICLENKCDQCENGIIRKKLRVIRKSGLAAIV